MTLNLDQDGWIDGYELMDAFGIDQDHSYYDITLRVAKQLPNHVAKFEDYNKFEKYTNKGKLGKSFWINIYKFNDLIFQNME